MLHREDNGNTPQDVSAAANLRGIVLVEQPSASLHSFAGRFELWAPRQPHADRVPLVPGTPGDEEVVTSVAISREVRGGWILLGTRFCSLTPADTAAGGPLSRLQAQE